MFYIIIGFHYFFDILSGHLQRELGSEMETPLKTTAKSRKSLKTLMKSINIFTPAKSNQDSNPGNGNRYFKRH